MQNNVKSSPCYSGTSWFYMKHVEEMYFIIYLLSIITQGQKLGQLDRLAYQMVRWVSTVGFDSEIQSRALASLVVIGMLHPDVMTAEQIYVLCAQVSDWLSQASLEQATNPHAKQKAKKMSALVSDRPYLLLCA